MIQFKKSLLIFIFTVSSGISFSQNILSLPVCNCCPTVYTCGGSTTQVVEVINPVTGKTWMDRNLGASQVATSITDAASYGDYFQWGRACEGHQSSFSLVSPIGATTVIPSSGNAWDGLFIVNQPFPFYWTTTSQTNLWNGINGLNNPCPPCYRVPTEAELNEELLSWSSSNAAGGFASVLKFPLPGYRDVGGSFDFVNNYGSYWSSTTSSTSSMCLYFNVFAALTLQEYRLRGMTVRCIKN